MAGSMGMTVVASMALQLVDMTVDQREVLTEWAAWKALHWVVVLDNK